MKKPYSNPTCERFMLSDLDILTLSNQGEGTGNSLAWNDGKED